jgi:hypothetical protein
MTSTYPHAGHLEHEREVDILPAVTTTSRVVVPKPARVTFSVQRPL